MKKLIKNPVLVLFAMLVINGCEKEDSDNPTNDRTTAVFKSDITYGNMTDQDGNTYKTVTIGTQTWMAENLRTTKYRDGTAIPEVTDFTAWVNLSTGACCTYNNTEDFDSIATFGRLYNGYAVNNSKNIAPAGWHVPTLVEWNDLITELGGSGVAGGKMKEKGETHWIFGNAGATNESGFTSLPAGTRCILNDFSDIGYHAYYWSSDGNQGIVLFDNDIIVGTAGYHEPCGVPVRLVKD